VEQDQAPSKSVPRELSLFHLSDGSLEPPLLAKQSLFMLIQNLPSLLKKLDIDLPFDPAIPSWGYTQKTVTQVTPEAPAHPCLLQHYSQ
jgi:hypothetical protein